MSAEYPYAVMVDSTPSLKDAGERVVKVCSNVYSKHHTILEAIDASHALNDAGLNAWVMSPDSGERIEL